ncbi:MAG: CrcB family protein [Planctomycetaceae bacterium]|jgi:CrcB protein|nr:CrcB family protein [Planctomycetaceae bacterium]
MDSFYLIFGIGIAGGLGSLARYGTGLGAAAIFGTAYPFGTLIVNVAGSFLFGFCAGTAVIPAAWKPVLLIGFLGGFTTFSALAFENYHFLTQQRYFVFAVHLLGQNILGIAAVLAGMTAAPYVIGVLTCFSGGRTG